MTSCDTNILFPACNSALPQHPAAQDFLSGFIKRDDFCLCEQVLLELYSLLRNPTVNPRPLSAKKAAAIIQRFRSNPNWPIVDVVLGSDSMDQVWEHAAKPAFPYRSIFDARLATTLRHHGVTHFATRNRKDFKSYGFDHVWDPFAQQPH